jgi:hypothetical protein
MNQTTEMASNTTQTGSSTTPVTTETNDHTRVDNTEPVLPYALAWKNVRISKEGVSALLTGSETLLIVPYNVDINTKIKDKKGRWSPGDKGWVFSKDVNVERDVLEPSLPDHICCRRAYDVGSSKDDFKCLDNCKRFKAVQSRKAELAEVARQMAKPHYYGTFVHEGGRVIVKSFGTHYCANEYISGYLSRPDYNAGTLLSIELTFERKVLLCLSLAKPIGSCKKDDYVSVTHYGSTASYKFSDVMRTKGWSLWCGPRRPPTTFFTTDVTIYWEHQTEIVRMKDLEKRRARVVPEPTNPFDINALKVVVEDEGIWYKVGCIRKQHSDTFPPGDYDCYFNEVSHSGFGRLDYRCVLTKRIVLPAPKKRKLRPNAPHTHPPPAKMDLFSPGNTIPPPMVS